MATVPEVEVVTDAVMETSSKIGVAPACLALGVPRATYYRRMRFGQGKMALKRTIHIPAAPSSAAYPETAFILPTRAHTLPLGVCFARTTSTSPRSSP